MGPEKREMNPEFFDEEVSDTLFQIREQFVGLGAFTPESLNKEMRDSIVEKLERLAQMAEEIGDKVKNEIYTTLSVRAYALGTIGIVDKRERFESEAVHLSQQIELILLCMDGVVAKNKGKILKSITEERDRWND